MSLVETELPERAQQLLQGDYSCNSGGWDVPGHPLRCYTSRSSTGKDPQFSSYSYIDPHGKHAILPIFCSIHPHVLHEAAYTGQDGLHSSSDTNFNLCRNTLTDTLRMTFNQIPG